MIAIVIVAILSAIAIPGYRSYVQRAQRAEAKTALLRIQGAQEKFFVQQNRYAAALAPAAPAGLGTPATTETGLYTLALVLTDGGDGLPRHRHGPRAAARRTTTRSCATLSIDNNGLKGARNSAGADTTRDCWR